jgi:hypothetical protein
MSSVFQKLPKHLLDHAFKCGDEFAWSRADALEVIKWADAHNLTVIGVEVWVPSPKGPIIPARYVYVWSLGRSQRRAGGAKSARDYVRDFEWDLNDTGFVDSEPYFNLTLNTD